MIYDYCCNRTHSEHEASLKSILEDEVNKGDEGVFANVTIDKTSISISVIGCNTTTESQTQETTMEPEPTTTTCTISD